MKNRVNTSSVTHAAQQPYEWHWVSHGLLHVILILVGAFALVPFIWMISTSLKTPAEALSVAVNFIPKTWHWQNYAQAFDTVPFARFYLNTIIVTIGRVAGQLILSSMAGYAFARLRFPGRDILFLAVLAVLMVPTQVTLIPNYILFKQLGWLDSYQGLIIPGVFSAFGTFLLRQFFATLPKELEDAATIDGCNPLQTYWHIALPLARTTLVAYGLLVTLWAWNDFLFPLIITNSTDMQMLSVGIAYFQGQNTTNFAVMMAAATMATMPMLVVFLFAQRSLIEGITMSGLKT